MIECDFVESKGNFSVWYVLVEENNSEDPIVNEIFSFLFKGEIKEVLQAVSEVVEGKEEVSIFPLKFLEKRISI